MVLCTPFTAGGGVNFDELDRLIDFQLAAGTEAIFFAGVGGEGPAMTDEEYAAVVAHGAARCRGRCIAGAGVAAPVTAGAVRLAALAAQSGAQVLLAAAPFYVRATPNGLVAHYTAVAGAAGGVPVIVSHIPLRTGVTMSSATLLRLAAIPGVAGIKDCSGDVPLVAEVVAGAPEGFAVWSGNDNVVVPNMALGAAGVISVAGNLVPQRMAAMVRLMREGDTAGAAAQQQALLPLIGGMFMEVNPIPAKTALGMLGFGMGPFRLPLCPMEPQHEKALAALLARYGLLAG